MKYFTGDLLEANVDVICHVANIYHTFGSGIAYFIRQTYPLAYEADLETENGCESKLGTFSSADVTPHLAIYNLYAMYGIGNNGHPLNRNLSYDHFYDAMYKVCEDIKASPIMTTIVGIPKYIGCCRAGGNWEIVNTMLQELEKQFSHIEFHVYELENGEITAQSTQPR
jgi:O-acetyl-ADP-ribose deacetylase (regulator of RNase III)